MRVKKADTVSYLGISGSYSYQAAKSLYPEATLVNYRTFSQAVEDCEAGGSDVTVVPVENSIAGRIADVHSLLLSINLMITQEHLLNVEHCLIIPYSGPNSKLAYEPDKIRQVHSHPLALSQCKGYIARHLKNAEAVTSLDTASAVKLVAEKGDPEQAAIGSSVAASTYNAQVVEENIADVTHNTTRFLALTAGHNLERSPDDNMTSLIFQVEHTPGALREALGAFDENEVNLTKLETYMVSDEITHPTFYVDIGAGLNAENMQRALQSLKSKSIYIKVLGSYRASQQRSVQAGILPLK